MNKEKAQSSLEETRPPIVVIMGHIDHGKTTLLDTIRKSNVAEKESGGITQHIGAYEVTVDTKEGESGKITFLDTPGHEAFAKMRSRGARVADIAILVIAADDGVKPQTLEALQAIKEAGIPFIVALNKIDKPSADPERIKQELATHEVHIEEWGGKTPVIPISAKNNQGIQDLLEMILLLADLERITASSEKPASGVVIESHLDPQRGNAATLLIKDGMLKRGDFVVTNNSYSPVRIFEDFNGHTLENAFPSQPVRITGFNNIPKVGREFHTAGTKREAEEFLHKKEAESTRPPTEEVSVGQSVRVLLVLKADTTGSLEAIEHEIKKIENERISIHFLKKATGPIGEDDIKIASASKPSAVIGFHVKTEKDALPFAERFGIAVKTFTIIYELIDWLKKHIKETVPLEKKEEATGRAQIIKIFSKKGSKQIVGGRVTSGTIKNKTKARIIRRDQVLAYGRIIELQHNRAPIIEAGENDEFGALIDATIEIAPKDFVETVEEKIIEHAF